MTTPQIIRTIFEFLAVGIILLMIKYEPELTAWEEKTFYKILDRFRGDKNDRIE